MLFNSLEFALFLPVVFALYWFVLGRSLRLQNLFLVGASYFFYGWWDPRFLLLILISSLTDYSVGRALGRAESPRARKALLGVSLLCNLGLLGFFKYYNFFLGSAVELLQNLGLSPNPTSLKVILPVGISFYTFQSLTYTIGLYRREMRPTMDVVQYCAFVSFFPQLVAGPIERAQALLPQFAQRRTFDYRKGVAGARRILWGLFKKVVVADTCATHVDAIFSNYDSLAGSTLLLGIVYFAFQIYGDFSGYSDVAIGVGRLFGFDLGENFTLPYLSRDIREFWTRWHISLSTWFRDYVYFPLGGGRCSNVRRVRNILLTFTLSGLWHGANWTYVSWGLVNGLCYVPVILLSNRCQRSAIVAQGRMLPSPLEALQMAGTFSLVLIGWVFFRAASLHDAVGYLHGLFSPTLFSPPARRASALVFILMLAAVEWFQREKKDPLDMGEFPSVVRWLVYLALTVLILACYSGERVFIYFQF